MLRCRVSYIHTISMQKTAYHHGDLRNAMLDAADELLASQGLQGFTLRGCARLAGVSHAAPKHHFADVKGLLAAVASRGFERLQTALKEALHAAGDELDLQMVATCRAYVQFARDNPEHFRIMFRSDLIDVDPAAQHPASMRETFRVLTNVILRQRGEPELDPNLHLFLTGFDLVDDVLIGWCHIHGFAHLLMEGQLHMTSEEELDQHIESTGRRLSGLLRQHVLANRP